MMFSEIRETFATIEKATRNVMRRVEHETSAVLFRLKRGIFTTAIELTLVLVSILFIVVGLILFVSRFIAIDIVLVVAGLIILNIVFIAAKFRPKA